MSEKTIHARLALAVRDEEAALGIGRELEKLGFKVVKASGRGINFSGETGLFEETFKCPVEDKSGDRRFAGEPEIPAAFKDRVDSIYFPSKPVFPG